MNNITKELLLTDYSNCIYLVKEDIFQNNGIIDCLNILKLLHQQYHPTYPDNRFESHKRYLSSFDFDISNANISVYYSDIYYQPPELIFIHIPKNGGTSYHSYFKDIYKQNIPYYLYMIDNFF